jgi:hypothetical protein
MGLFSARGQSKPAGTKARFEQSLCFEHEGLRFIGVLVETNSVNPCLIILRVLGASVVKLIRVIRAIRGFAYLA